MSVTTTHPDYAAHLPEWELMGQALGGEFAIKADDRNLPKPAGMIEAERKDPSKTYLYAAYRTRAQYQHWVRDGVRAMMGLVSRQLPTIELPERIAHMQAEATADGYSLRQLFLRTVEHVLSKGRVVLMVDVDDTGRPFIALYSAEAAINWKARKVNGRDDLSLVVLAEQRLRANVDEFSHDSDTVFRVLDLEDGRFRVRVLNESGDAVEEERTPGEANSRGETIKGIDYLPVVFCGSMDNAPDVDEVPLLTMAKAALADYQLSADYFTSLHQTSHPQPWVAGLQDDVELSVTGPSAAWDLGPTGSCGYLEFQGAGIEAVRQAMADQKNSALEAGARVMDMGGVESGEARKTRQNDQHATLHGIVVTAAEAIEQALRYAAERVGIEDVEKQVIFTVVPEFQPAEVDPQVLTQLQASVVAGGVSWATYWQYLTTGKLPEHDYAEESGLIEGEGPPLGTLQDGNA